MFYSLFVALFIRAASLAPETAEPVLRQILAPQTGDINVMIIVAVILIAAFLMFILLKSKRRDR